MNADPNIAPHVASVMEWVIGTGFFGLSAVTGYFLKRQNDKIDSFADKLETTKDAILNDVKNNKKEIVEMFNDICHERQGSCALLQDAKLLTVNKDGEILHQKVERIKEDRLERWKRQEKINQKVSNHIAKDDK